MVRKLSFFLSKKYDLPIISPFNVNRRWPQIGKTVYPGPEEWLSLLKNSKFVVTNTFHGVVFSILFKKKFIATELPKNKKKYSGRIKDILKNLSLYNRYIDEFNHNKIEKILDLEIKWSKVEKKVNILKMQGKKFLNKLDV